MGVDPTVIERLQGNTSEVLFNDLRLLEPYSQTPDYFPFV